MHPLCISMHLKALEQNCPQAVMVYVGTKTLKLQNRSKAQNRPKIIFKFNSSSQKACKIFRQSSLRPEGFFIPFFFTFNALEYIQNHFKRLECILYAFPCIGKPKMIKFNTSSQNACKKFRQSSPRPEGFFHYVFYIQCVRIHSKSF